jgi:predicted short-subunit dehydrogenase-like oxidoreductase (DUF2520 family)
MMTGQPSIGIVGAGKVGSTLARLLYQHKYAIAALYSPTRQHAQTLADRVSAPVVNTVSEVVAQADLILLTVPDDAIATVAAEIGDQNVRGKAFVHTSGAHDSSVLARLAATGGLTGSLHPAFPFADVETSVAKLPGTTFAVEAADDRLLGWLLDIVAALGGRALVIPPGKKALYHAALALASNYTVTLYALAERLLLSLDADRETIDAALNSLVAATVANLQEQGIPAALTGPLTRADVGTVAAHMIALTEIDAPAAELYRRLAEMTLPLLVERGVDIKEIEMLLNEY